ncbi:ribosome hibernation-promoting factor, HPF/YfiA family [Hydrogenobaculum acidophilum]
MQIEFIGKHFEITDHLKAFVESKLSKFKRLLRETGEDQIETVVTITSARAKHTDDNINKTSIFRVDVDIYIKNNGGGTVHAWEEDKDVYTAIDRVMDEIERQLLKLKERRLNYRRKSSKAKEGIHETTFEQVEEQEQTKPFIIEETFYVEKPMSVEDAILELTDNHMMFLPFMDIKDGKVKILYRKRSDSFGVIDLGCKG